jgi:chromosome segregation ATPase
MKKKSILPIIICFAMICSCQKQDSAAEQQLAQRKTELDARETALDERLNALDEKVNALDKRLNAFAENEKSKANVQTIPPDAQSRGVIRDEAQTKAERDTRIQEFRAEIRARIPDPSKVTAGDPAKQERPAPRQLGPEDLQRQWQQNLDKAKMSGKAVFPAAEAGSPIPSPAVEATSPSPSPTP